MKHLLLLLLILFGNAGTDSYGQANSDSLSKFDQILAFPDKLFFAIEKQSLKLEADLANQTEKLLSKLQKQEERLKRKLMKRDSVLAKELFGDIEQRYQALRNTSQKVGRYNSMYSPRLDSLATALSFLNTENALASFSQNGAYKNSLHVLADLHGNFNKTEAIRKLISQRQGVLKEHLGKLGMIRELRKFQKQVYYYQAQVRAYKEIWENPQKLERKLLELLVKTPQFRDFFARNSQLGQLFALPGAGEGASGSISVAGLQARASIQQQLQDRFGPSASAGQLLQQNVQGAEAQLSGLKNRINQYSSGSFGNSSEELDMPEGFKPNGQKTKSFLKRIELGGNFQSQRARYYFPVTSDIALSAGYKLNDMSLLGIGASYKIGWGSGWNHIDITHQGVGLRSFVDYRIKGGFFISGGYEQNYRSLLTTIEQLKDYSAWQSSGLIGLSKKYKVSKKLNGSVQLLWDFLSNQQVPRTQPVLFRVGYSLN